MNPASTSRFHVAGTVFPAARAVLALLAALCMGMAWLVPNHYLPWHSFHNESLMVVALLLLMAAGHRCSAPVVAGVAAAIAAIPWLQWKFGLLPYSGDAWVSTLYLFALASAIGTGYAWAQTDAKGFAERLAWPTLAAGLVSAVLAMTQTLDIARWGIWAVEVPPGGRGLANLAQPNNLASLLGLAVISVWCLFERRRLGRISAAALLLPLLLGIVTTQSRTALLFAPMLFLLHRWFARCGVAWRARPSAIAAAAVALFAFSALWPLLTKALLLAPPDNFLDRGSASRLAVWRVLVDALAQSPWRGYGWLQIGAAQLEAVDRHPPGSAVWFQAHNLFLELLLWCGVPLGLLLGALTIAWYVSRLRRTTTPEAAVGMMVVSVLGLHAMFEYPNHYLYFLIPMGLWIGLVESGRASPALLPRSFAAAFGIVTAALALAIAWDYESVEADFRLMRFEMRNIGKASATQAPLDAPFLSGLTAYMRVSRVPVTAGMSDAQLADMETVTTRFPYMLSLLRYAQALALNGRSIEARQVFIKMRHMFGEGPYDRARTELQQRVNAGETGLRALAASLPE